MAQNYKVYLFILAKSKNFKKRLKILLIIDFYQNYPSFLKKLKN